ncbi:MAG: hypothetical protein FJ298_15520 [Planctomycetes bacterium]|nr:hypothetical protein [Planctomycetota bacterium]
MSPKLFPSKIDWWLGALLCVPPIAAVSSLVALCTAREAASWVGWIPLVLVVAIYGGLVFPMRYEVHDDALVIRFGRFRSRVRYGDIRGVKPTRNPISSPALSLRRLHIDAGSSLGPNISPADQDGFLAALAERTPHLRRQGDSLVPREAD